MTFPKVTVYTYMGNDLLFKGLKHFIDMEYFKNYTADPGHASFSITLPNNRIYRKMRDDFEKKLEYRYKGCDDNGKKIEGKEKIPAEDRVENIFRTRKMDKKEKYDYQLSLINSLSKTDYNIFNKMQKNEATASEIEEFNVNNSEFLEQFYMDEVIDCHWSFWPDDDSKLGYQLKSQSTDFIGERDGKHVEYSKKGEEFLGDIIERRAHGGNKFTYAPFGFVREAGLEDEDKKLLGQYVEYKNQNSLNDNLEFLLEAFEKQKKYNTQRKKDSTTLKDELKNLPVTEEKMKELIGKVEKLKKNIENLNKAKIVGEKKIKSLISKLVKINNSEKKQILTEKLKLLQDEDINLKNNIDNETTDLEKQEKELTDIKEKLKNSKETIKSLTKKLEKKDKFSVNTMSILERAIPNYEDILLKHKIPVEDLILEKAIDVLIKEAEEKLNIIGEKIKKLKKVVNKDDNKMRIHELEKDFIVFGGEADSATELPISGPNGGGNGLNPQAMFDQMLNELTDGKGFELRTKNCSTTTNNIVMAGLKNNDNEEYLEAYMKNESKLGGIIVNPSSVHAGAIAIKKRIDEGNKKPSIWERIRVNNPVHKLAKSENLYYALVENKDGSRFTYKEVIEASKLKVPDWINNNLLKLGEEQYFRGINAEDQQKIWVNDFIDNGVASNKKEATEKFNELKKFINDVNKQFKRVQINSWIKIIVYSAPQLIIERVVNPKQTFNEITSFMKYAFSLKSKNTLAKVMKGFAVAAAIPAAIIAPFAGIQAVIEAGVKRIKLTKKIKESSDKTVESTEYNKAFGERIKEKKDVVEISGPDTASILEEFYYQLDSKYNSDKVVVLDNWAQSKILKSIKKGQKIKEINAKFDAIKAKNDSYNFEIDKIRVNIDKVKNAIESQKAKTGFESISKMKEKKEEYVKTIKELSSKLEKLKKEQNANNKSIKIFQKKYDETLEAINKAKNNFVKENFNTKKDEYFDKKNEIVDKNDKLSEEIKNTLETMKKTKEDLGKITAQIIKVNTYEQKLSSLKKKKEGYISIAMKSGERFKALNKRLEQVVNKVDSGKILDKELLAKMHQGGYITKTSMESGLVEDVYKDLAINSYKRISHINKKIKDDLNIKDKYIVKNPKIKFKQIEKLSEFLKKAKKAMHSFKKIFKTRYEIIVEISKINKMIITGSEYFEDLADSKVIDNLSKIISFVKLSENFKKQVYETLRENGIPDEEAKKILSTTERATSKFKENCLKKLNNHLQEKVEKMFKLIEDTLPSLEQKIPFSDDEKALKSKVTLQLEDFKKIAEMLNSFGAYEFAYMEKNNLHTKLQEVQKKINVVREYYANNFQAEIGKHLLSGRNKYEKVSDKIVDLIAQIEKIEVRQKMYLGNINNVVFKKALTNFDSLSKKDTVLQDVSVDGYKVKNVIPDLPKENFDKKASLQDSSKQKQGDISLFEEKTQYFDEQFKKMQNEIDGGFTNKLNQDFDIKEGGYQPNNFTQEMHKKIEKFGELYTTFISFADNNFNDDEYAAKYGIDYDKISIEINKAKDLSALEPTEAMKKVDNFIIEKINFLKKECVKKYIEKKLTHNARNQYYFVTKAREDLKSSTNAEEVLQVAEKLNMFLKGTSLKSKIRILLGKSKKTFFKMAGLSRSSFKALDKKIKILDKHQLQKDDKLNAEKPKTPNKIKKKKKGWRFKR